jgi:lactoylglutathione lyase
VRDIDASVGFYVKGRGFRMTKEWVDDGKLRWCWIELGDVAVMLQEFWTEGQHRNLPEAETGVSVSICFLCDTPLRCGASSPRAASRRSGRSSGTACG